MITALPVTIIVEGVIGLVYSIWREKPVVPILITGILANLLTQPLLWIAVSYFFQHYLATLFVAEILIWMFESLLLYGFRFNRLNFRESFYLSFSMNLASFSIGWLLPV